MKSKKREIRRLPNKNSNSCNINSSVNENILQNLDPNTLENLIIIRKSIRKKFGIYVSILDLLNDSINHFSDFMSSEEGIEYYLYSRGMFL